MKIIIIGGSFAGIQAAMTCREMNQACEILILEATNDLLYYPVEFKSDLMKNQKDQSMIEKSINITALSEQRIDCHLNTFVTEIQPNEKYILYEKNGETEKLHYDYLVLAMGSQQYIGIKDADISKRVIRLDSEQHLKESQALVNRVKEVMVIGGGQLGIEMSEMLLKLGKKVTLLEAGEHLAFKLFDQWLMNNLQDDLLNAGLTLKCNESYQSVSLDEDILVVKSHRQSYRTDAIQFAVNVEPNTQLVEEILRLNPDGTIWTDEFLQTSDPSIFACGDLIKWPFGQQEAYYYIPLISHVKLSGRIVGMNIFGNNQRLPLSPRAIAMTIFDNDYFSCGKTLQELEYSQTDFYISRYQDEGFEIQCLSQTHSGEILGIQMRGLSELNLASSFTLVLTAVQARLTDQFLASQMNVYQGYHSLLPNAWFDAINQHWRGRQQWLQEKEQYHAN